MSEDKELRRRFEHLLDALGFYSNGEYVTQKMSDAMKDCERASKIECGVSANEKVEALANYLGVDFVNMSRRIDVVKVKKSKKA